MIARIIKSFSYDAPTETTGYRIVETTREVDDVAVADKYVLEYQTTDLVGAPAWRTMCATSAALTDQDPLAVLLRELRATGWF